MTASSAVIASIPPMTSAVSVTVLVLTLSVMCTRSRGLLRVGALELSVSSCSFGAAEVARQDLRPLL